MKLIAFTDFHENMQMLQRIKQAIAQEKPDVAVCAGDFTTFARSTKKVLTELNNLGVPLVLIHGNHDDEDETVMLLQNLKNLIPCNKRV